MESRKWSRESIFAYGAHCSQSTSLHRFCHQVNTINSVFLTSLVITLLGIGAHFTAKVKTLANKLNRTFLEYNFETSKGKVFFFLTSPTKSSSTCKVPCFVFFKGLLNALQSDNNTDTVYTILHKFKCLGRAFLRGRFSSPSCSGLNESEALT